MRPTEPTEPSSTRAEARTLANGVRVLLLPMPQCVTAAVSVFVRAGSVHEPPERNGVSHVVEHMAFKGTATRDARAINLDAERLGADVNAHTDRDHTAFHMRGLSSDAPEFVRMLGDIVRASTFPDDELERERGVLLAELADDEDDPVAATYRRFDALCYGDHPAAQPVIGTARVLRRLRSADLAAHVRRLYTGCNLVVAAAGGFDRARVAAAAEVAFRGGARGAPNAVRAPAWVGGLRRRAHEGSSQSHAVLGYPIPGLRARDPAAIVAAALFGEGMSSPLLHELRERRGLAYHAACHAEEREFWGQFTVEVSTAPEALDEALDEVARLLVACAMRIEPAELKRARRQVVVRALRELEQPERRLEHAALDLLASGRTRPAGELLAAFEAVTGERVRALFARLRSVRPALAIGGHFRRDAGRRAHLRLAAAR